MAIQDQLAILKRGAKSWNRWRDAHPAIQPELSGANLRGANLREAELSGAELSNAELSGAELSNADLRGANLREAEFMGSDLRNADLRGSNLRNADLRGANLREADLSNTNLRGANLREADLRGAELSNADLRGAELSNAELSGAELSRANLSRAILSEAKLNIADLSFADLSETDLSNADLIGSNLRNADLSNADLSRATLVDTNFEEAAFTNCRIYGIAAWNVDLKGARQDHLVITPPDEPTITVDNLKIAQFIYLLLTNREIREVIDTVGQKGVLILGRFSPERKVVLDALHQKLRALDFVPIIFDFERATTRDFTETLMTLAGLCRFIIADVTNPKSSPMELQATVPDYSIPFVPIIQEGEKPFSMFKDLQIKYHWVLGVRSYSTVDNLIENLEGGIVKQALEKHAELIERKAGKLKMEDIGWYSRQGTG